MRSFHLIIIDDNGWQLSNSFIPDDEQIGYDIYCTTLQMLDSDAECPHAQISKLMDSQIIYAANDIVTERLDLLMKKGLRGIIRGNAKTAPRLC